MGRIESVCTVCGAWRGASGSRPSGSFMAHLAPASATIRTKRTERCCPMPSRACRVASIACGTCSATSRAGRRVHARRLPLRRGISSCHGADARAHQPAARRWFVGPDRGARGGHRTGASGFSSGPAARGQGRSPTAADGPRPSPSSGCRITRQPMKGQWRFLVGKARRWLESQPGPPDASVLLAGVGSGLESTHFA